MKIKQNYQLDQAALEYFRDQIIEVMPRKVDQILASGDKQ